MKVQCPDCGMKQNPTHTGLCTTCTSVLDQEAYLDHLNREDESYNTRGKTPGAGPLGLPVTALETGRAA